MKYIIQISKDFDYLRLNDDNTWSYTSYEYATDFIDEAHAIDHIISLSIESITGFARVVEKPELTENATNLILELRDTLREYGIEEDDLKQMFDYYDLSELHDYLIEEWEDEL